MQEKNMNRECREVMSVPAWIEQDITFGQVESIIEGGCDSGAYMPAVTYYDARQTMAEHGDDVMDYLSDIGACLDIQDKSWSQVCTYLLSSAVELWASEAADKIEEIEAEEEEEEEEESEAA